LWEHQNYKEQAINNGWGERRRLEEGKCTKHVQKEWMWLQNVCLWKDREELMNFGHKVTHPGGNASG
jgi:hypothetical protein